MKGSSLPLFSPPRSRRFMRSSPQQEFYLADATPFEERELVDVCSFVENDDDHLEIVKAVDTPKPFAGFGSFRQRHGDSSYSTRSTGVAVRRLSAYEAPARLGSGAAALQVAQAPPSAPIDINGYGSFASTESTRPPSRLGKQHPFSSDTDREEAWERKRELYLVDESSSAQQKTSGGDDGTPLLRTMARSVSDCGNHRPWPASEKSLVKARTRSLTDEDLEELKGCIDLGFGFSSGDDHGLSGTLPALELYYAISRQYSDIRSRSSMASPSDGTTLCRTSSEESSSSPLSDSWRVSSPGDHPNRVKTRLRHWAQAVACSIKQGFSL